MQAIPRADTYFRINPKLSAVGGSQVPYGRFNFFFYFSQVINAVFSFFSFPNMVGVFRLIEAAMDKSVKEIISTVIQRSVTIASRTTKELILKVLVRWDMMFTFFFFC
jgi:CCR4-NOT transcription complex subunit 1